MYRTAERIFEDKELGRVTVRTNARARRMTFRTREDGLHVTVPPRISLTDIRSAIEELRPRLLAAKQKQVRRLIDLDYRIDAELFQLRLVTGQGNCFQARSDVGRVEIVCPPDTDFTDENLQAWLRRVIEESLRKNAKVLLPSRLYALAERHGLHFDTVKINSANGRWGSCSVRGSINLSFRLLLLPAHLIDYVMLHELAHTREMNHGDRFWSLLNQLTDGKALTLREELKHYHTAI